MASLTLHHVSKHYGSGASATPVIHQLSAAIEDGEFVVIVGPSGCGKSTLLRMVAGLEGASSGDIHIGAQRVNDLEPSARDIAMVFQNYALYPHMTVFDNMAYGLKLAKLPAATINTRVRHVADILELGPLLQRKPQALSGGQRQRVAMGRAIVRQPQLFLFDEPLSNLDTQLRGHTRLEIQKLHRELGTTSLYVTHDQVEAMTLAQRVLVLNQGKVEQFDTPQAVYARPASIFVARFMGASPMNLLRHAPHTPAGLTLGVRPEHLDISPSGWPLTAYAIETLGAERLIYAHWTHILQDNTKRTTPSETLILRTDEATPTPALGSPFYATPRPDRLHYFDTATGLRKDPAAHPL